MTGPTALDETIAVVSDLHLADGRHDPFPEDELFARTIGSLVSAASGHRLRLVLLGDTFDFPAVPLLPTCGTPATSPAEAQEKLGRILAAHPAVVQALRDLLEAGHRLDVVAGNHDMELLFPGVHERLTEELGQGALAVHPWLLHVPGLLYAEHGQQHHDFNRFPWLGTAEPGDLGVRLPVPAGSFVDALAHLRGRVAPGAGPAVAAGHAVRMSVGLVGALASLSRAEHARGERERRLAAAPPAALSPAAAVGIDRVAAATPTSIGRRALRLTAARLRRSRGDAAPPYMQAAAAAVHDVLAAEGLAVPFYVFGHTHVVADAPLGGGAARYLNPGTWSTATRRVPGGERRCGVVLIERRSGAAPRARVHCPG